MGSWDTVRAATVGEEIIAGIPAMGARLRRKPGSPDPAPAALRRPRSRSRLQFLHTGSGKKAGVSRWWTRGQQAGPPAWPLSLSRDSERPTSAPQAKHRNQLPEAGAVAGGEALRHGPKPFRGAPPYAHPADRSAVSRPQSARAAHRSLARPGR